MDKKSYVTHSPGNKNSKGESAPWVIKSHENGKIISSHKTKEEATSHLRDIEGHKGSSMEFKGINNIDELIKKAGQNMQDILNNLMQQQQQQASNDPASQFVSQLIQSGTPLDQVKAILSRAMAIVEQQEASQQQQAQQQQIQQQTA